MASLVPKHGSCTIFLASVFVFSLVYIISNQTISLTTVSVHSSIVSPLVLGREVSLGTWPQGSPAARAPMRIVVAWRKEVHDILAWAREGMSHNIFSQTLCTPEQGNRLGIVERAEAPYKARQRLRDGCRRSLPVVIPGDIGRSGLVGGQDPVALAPFAWLG